jgi:K(+)-stimulated pyrophosphate-energized sodium pump
MKASCCAGENTGKCDLSKCATMTKDECAKMCDSLHCSPEQKANCLSHYGPDGKFIAPKECKEGDMKECKEDGKKKDCCDDKK